MADKSFQKRTIWIILLVIILLIAGRFFLPALGETLVAEDEPVKSDVIVVLMGGGLDRMYEAVDLYKGGYGERILMVRNYQPGYEEADAQGIAVTRESEMVKSAAMQLDVPEEDILILPGDARSTQEEALAVKKYLQAHAEVDSLIIATSPTHSARAKKIFQWAMEDLDREVRVISCPSSYVEFDAAHWWRDREDAGQVFLEHVKMINFYLLDRWKYQTCVTGTVLLTRFVSVLHLHKLVTLSELYLFPI